MLVRPLLRPLTGLLAASLVSPTEGASAPPAIAAPFSRVNGTADGPVTQLYAGWSVYSDTPITDMTAFDADYPGFDNAGLPTTYRRRLYVTKPVRQRWPNHLAGQEPGIYAVSSHIHKGVTFPGASVTNNETRSSPKPICGIGLNARRVFGDTGRFELITMHMNARAGQPVPLARLKLNGGAVTVDVTACTVLPPLFDRFPVYGYSVPEADLTGLPDVATFTEDWEVFPWFGDNASIAKTVDGTAANVWEFATKTHLRHRSRALNPPLVYVTATGTDETVNSAGVGGTSGTQKVSTNAATAKATAFAGYASAVQALDAATSLTGGFTDGCEVRISNVTIPAGALLAGTYQSGGEFVITRDPLETKASCVLQLSGTAFNARHSWIKIRDLTVNRIGTAFAFSSLSQLVLENCDFDGGGFSGQLLGTGGHIAVLGCNLTNCTSTNFSAGSADVFLFRGNRSTDAITVEARCTVGNDLENSPGANVSATRGGTNIVVAFNRFAKMSSGIFSASGIELNNVFIGQNLAEFNSGVSNPVLRVSGDDETGNTDHICIVYQTEAGAFGAGRRNDGYDETNAVRRYQSRWMEKGNVIVQDNCKLDWFHGASDGGPGGPNPEGFTSGSPSTAVGNFARYYGVDCEGNLTLWPSPNPLTENRVFSGLSCLVGTSSSAALIAATTLWTDPKATTYDGVSAYTAGAGGGTYTLKPGTAALGIVPEAILPGTLDGQARPLTNDNPGAYGIA